MFGSQRGIAANFFSCTYMYKYMCMHTYIPDHLFVCVSLRAPGVVDDGDIRDGLDILLLLVGLVVKKRLGLQVGLVAKFRNRIRVWSGPAETVCLPTGIKLANWSI